MGSRTTDYNAVDENEKIHRVMMEVKPLLEASGKVIEKSLMLTHDGSPANACYKHGGIPGAEIWC